MLVLVAAQGSDVKVLRPQLIVKLVALVLAVGFIGCSAWSLSPDPWRTGVDRVVDAEGRSTTDKAGGGDHQLVLVLIVFAVPALAFGLPNSTYLRLTADGFTARLMFMSCQLQWTDILSVRATSSHVAIDFAPSCRRAHTESGFRPLALRPDSSGARPLEYALPYTCGRKAAEVARVLNEWRTRTMT